MIRNDKLITDFLNGLVDHDCGNDNIKICRHGSKLYSYGNLIAQFIINKRGKIVLVVHCPENDKRAVCHYGLLIGKAIELRETERKFPIMEYTVENFSLNDYRKAYETEIDKFNRIA